MQVRRAVLEVKRFGMPITRPTVALLFVLQDLTVLVVYLMTCERSCRPNATAQATLDALIGVRSRTRAAMHPRAQLLSSSSHMNLPSSLSVERLDGRFIWLLLTS